MIGLQGLQNFFRKNIGLIIICLMFFILGIFRLNDLSIYTPDSARYLIFGNSLAHGNGFTDNTQPEPDRFVVQGPLYPIILVPAEILFPLSLIAAKIWTLLWGVLAIVLFYRWILTRVNKGIALSATSFFAFNPLMLVYSSEVLSEAPFLALLIYTIHLIEKFTEKHESSNKLFVVILITVTTVTLLREVGIALFLALLLFLFSRKLFARTSILFLVTISILILWYVRNRWLIGTVPQSLTSNYALAFEHIVTSPNESLLHEIAVRVWMNITSSFIQLGGMLLYPLFLAKQFKLALMPSDFYLFLTSFFTGIGKYLVLILALPLMIYGIILDIQKSKAGILKLLFGMIYFGILLIYPVYDVRFLLVLLPLMIYYCALSIHSLIDSGRIPARFKKSSFTLLVGVFLIVPNAASIFEILKLNLAYRKSPVNFFQTYGQTKHCPVMFTQPWSLLGNWIQNNLPDSATIASPSKDLAIVVGDRKVLEIDQGVVEYIFEMLLRDNEVEYILSPSRGYDLKIYDFLMFESKRYSFEEIHHEGNLYLYRVHSRLREGTESLTKTSSTFDTMSANYFIQKGRIEMLNGNYSEANKFLTSALAFDSTHPAILYQMIIYYALTNDSIHAKYYYDKLYTLPQALGYTLPSRLQLKAMTKLNYALAENNPMNKMQGIYDAASMYWKLGYQKRAQQVMNDFFLTDTSFFTGLLWGMHYNNQLGDFVNAKKYLSTLTKIDKENPVVSAFTKVISLEDSLQLEKNNIEKSRLHFLIGSLYKEIELNEEAIDEAERSLSFDNKNTSALILMAEIFERKSDFRMAKKIYQKVLSIQPMNQDVQNRLSSLQSMYTKK